MRITHIVTKSINDMGGEESINAYKSLNQKICGLVKSSSTPLSVDEVIQQMIRSEHVARADVQYVLTYARANKSLYIDPRTHVVTAP